MSQEPRLQDPGRVAAAGLGLCHLVAAQRAPARLGFGSIRGEDSLTLLGPPKSRTITSEFFFQTEGRIPRLDQKMCFL